MKIKIFLGLTIFLAFVLRFFQLGNNPPSPYWDETSLGYNAFAIAQTLHDEHNEFLPLTRFIAFGDYKAPGYIYAAAGAIKLFGLSETATRLPSALAGTLLVLVTYFLAKELFHDKRISLLGALFVAISPWSLQLSRGAFEANLATLFSGTGILFFLVAVHRNKSIFYLLSSIFLVLSMYTFNTHRVFVPLLVFVLALIFFKKILSVWKRFLLFGFCCLVLVLPLLLYSRTREAQLRFTEVSWVNDLAPIELSNQRIGEDGNNLAVRLIHNRRVVYSLEFLKHYLDQFRSDFLFITGDANPRLSAQAVGELYLFDLPFLFIGIFFLIKHRNRASAVLFSWTLLAGIPAAFARETPHALRTLNFLPVPQIIVAFGVVSFLNILRQKFSVNSYKLYLIPPLIVLYLLSFGFYLNNYHTVYPAKFASFWQYGYKQAVEYVSVNQSKYDHVGVTGYYGRPYIYFLFFQKYPPEKYWQSRNADRDWFGFWYVHGFDKYVFDDVTDGSGRWLYVSAPGQTPRNAKILTTINDLQNQPVFEISEKRQ